LLPASLGGDACSASDPQTCRSYTIATVAGTGSVLIGADVEVDETVTEVIPTGWILESASCQVEGEVGTTGSFDSINTISGIAIEPGKFTTCAFTNARQPANLTVTKVVINDNGGTASASDFTLKVGSTTLASGQQTQIPAGDYVVSETGGPSGYRDKRVRALRPWAEPDLALLRTVNRGEFSVNGFRNRDLQSLLFDQPPDNDDEKRRRSARVSRLLR
jgi:hypothetical protein